MNMLIFNLYYIYRLTAEKSDKMDLCSGEQQDAEEFFTALLDVLEKELKTMNNFKMALGQLKGRLKEQNKFISHPSGKCVKCGFLPSSVEHDFFTLKLVVPPCEKVNLERLVDGYFLEEDSGLRMKCSTCCQCFPVCKQTGFCNRPAISQRILINAPEILVIQLLRFAHAIYRSKITAVVETKSTLRLKGCMDYELIGVLDHRGSTITSGHYVYTVKSESSQWLICNDLSVSSTPFEKIISGDNYLLVFKKKTAETQTYVPEFIPTTEWQEVLPGQKVPGGCQYELSLNGGPVRAKLLESSETDRTKERKEIHPDSCGKNKELQKQSTSKEYISSPIVIPNITSNCENIEFLDNDGVESGSTLKDDHILSGYMPSISNEPILIPNYINVNVRPCLDKETAETIKGSADKEDYIISGSMSFISNDKLSIPTEDNYEEIDILESSIKEILSINHKTPSQEKELKRLRRKLRNKKYQNKMTEERKEDDRQKKKQNMQDVRHKESEEEKQTRRQKDRQQKQTAINKESEEEKQTRRQKDRQQKETAINKECEEEKKTRRMKVQEVMQNVRNMESEEEKQGRRQKDHQNKRHKRSMETNQLRQLRLKKIKESMRSIRNKYRMEGKAIKRLNMFRERVRWGPSFPCIICHQVLFKHQVNEYTTEFETKLQNKCPTNLIKRTLSTPPDHFYKLMEEQRALDYEHRMKYKKANPGLPVPDQITLASKQEGECGHSLSAICHNSNKKGTLFICRVCSNHLKKKKIPPKANTNSLKALVVPENIKLKSYLEEALIARVLLFIKIFSLKSSLMPAMKDKCIVIPLEKEDINKTVECLPRLPSESGIIDIQWKRRVGQKNAHLEAKVDPVRIFNALQFLKDCGNPHYINIQKRSEYEERCHTSDPVGYNLLFGENSRSSRLYANQINYISDGSSEPILELSNYLELIEEQTIEKQFKETDAVRRYQIDYDDNICMVEQFPEAMQTEGVMQSSENYEDRESTEDPNQLHVVAPGEGKTPINLLYCEDWDAKAFPMLHPDGRNHLSDDQRQIKLSDLDYFKQRLFNINPQWRRNIHWVFAATVYREKKDLQRNIDIGYSRGKRNVRDDGGVQYSLKDPYSVFQNVANTPAYHKKGRMEMMARLDNFGPFHVFFTLCCADYRWPENITSILHEHGIGLRCSINFNHTETYEVLSDSSGWISMEDYMKNEMDESLHEIMRKNVVIATRNYQQRVAALMHTIVRNPSNPLSVKHFSSKLEFQARGAGHHHSTLWLDINKIEQKVDLCQLNEMKHSKFSAICNCNIYLENHLSDSSKYNDSLDEFLKTRGIDPGDFERPKRKHRTFKYLEKLTNKQKETELNQ